MRFARFSVDCSASIRFLEFIGFMGLPRFREFPGFMEYQVTGSRGLMFRGSWGPLGSES